MIGAFDGWATHVAQIVKSSVGFIGFNMLAHALIVSVAGR